SPHWWREWPKPDYVMGAAHPPRLRRVAPEVAGARRAPTPGQEGPAPSRVPERGATGLARREWRGDRTDPVEPLRALRRDGRAPGPLDQGRRPEGSRPGRRPRGRSGRGVLVGRATLRVECRA